MPKTRVINCPECDSKIRVSVRDDGEIVVLGSEKREYSPLEELRKV